MKASELRIGNFVAPQNDGDSAPPKIADYKHPHQVLEIGIFNSEVLPIGQVPAQVEKWIKFPNNRLAGIPLTEEWLKRFGFVFHDMESFDGNEKPYESYRLFIDGKRIRYIYATISPDDNNIDVLVGDIFDSDEESMFYVGHIKTVHQLQNLYFALTGEELILKP